MRKIYFLLAAVLMFVSQTVSAQTMSEENEVLQSEQYNMLLFRNYDFVNGTYNGNPFTNDAGETVSGDGCLTLSPDAASFKLNGFEAFQVLSPVEMSNFYVQIGTSAINLRAGVNKDGLHNYGSGARWAAIADMKAGQILVIEHSEGTNDGKGNETTVKPNVMQNNGASGWADVPTDPIQVEDITAEIHDIQDLVDADGDGEPDMAHDTHHYWKVINDGFVYIDMERNTHVKAIQVWIDASAAEAVSSPVINVVGAKGSTRFVDIAKGESTLGNECSVWYGILEKGEHAIYLEDTEEIDHMETVYEIDEETGDTISMNEVPVYKKVLATSVDEAGDYLYNPEDGFIEVSANDDEDGDGYITLEAATVSSSGAFSDIVTLQISVELLKLNDPTATLVAIDGVNRTYKLGWVNNIRGGAAYTFLVEGADDGEYEAWGENEGVGELFTIKHHATITVKAEGYEDGVLELDADLADIDVHRKNNATDGEGNVLHDWDFSHPAQDVVDAITGRKVIGYYEIVGEGEERDSVVYTIEEAEQHPDALPLYEDAGWWLPVSNNRTTLNVVSDTIYTGEIYDKNSNGYGYVEEKSGIFNGLSISCPPNANNASCIFYYDGKGDGNETGTLGVYFMARPTITFPREVAKAGEIVHIYYGQGGSNYTTNSTHALYTVPEDELLTVTLPSGGVHVFYIDVYTYADLPEDNYDAAIESTTANATVAAIYTLSGTRVASMQKGINLVKMSDGKVVKMFVK